MAEPEDSIAKAPHMLFPDLGSPRPPPVRRKTYGFLVDMLSRAASFIVFAALLTTFPSQAPEFANNRGWWELLHLLLVGIAVSYGLFSRCNKGDSASDKEALHGADAPHGSCVAQFLQVSSVFDEEEEEEDTRCVPHYGDKLQASNSRHRSLEPTVVVQGSNHKSCTDPGRPLLLPIRSLIRSRIPDVEESTGDKGGVGQQVVHPGVASCSFSKKSSCRVQSGGVGAVVDQSLEDSPPPSRLNDDLTRSAVLRSPIPWQYTGSATTETWDETRGATATAIAAAAPPSSSYLPPTHRAPSSQPSNSGDSTTPRRRLSPSPSDHPRADQMRDKVDDDSGKKSRTFYKPPPPPPPPPRPLNLRTPYDHPSPSSDRKDAKRSFKDQLKDFGGRNSPGMRARTVVPAIKEAVQDSVTAGRSHEPESARFSAQIPPSPAYKHGSDEEIKPYKEEEQWRFQDGVYVETEDSESDDVSEAASDVGERPPIPAEKDKNEVDKKADEFIAKFREQIRLQRIESIRRSAEQSSRRTHRQ